MLLIGLNIGLVASSLVSLWISQGIPPSLAIACEAVGGVTIYSRFKTWKTGTLKYYFDLVRDNEKAAKQLKVFDSMFWATSVFNSMIFLYVFSRYVSEYFKS